MPDIPEEFWVEPEAIGNPFEAKRLLESEIDRLKKENAELKAALQQARTERDTLREQKIRTDNTNVFLVSQGRKK